MLVAKRNGITRPHVQAGMGKVPKVITAGLIAAMALGGCTGHAKTAHGTVTGSFVMVGGPADLAHPSGIRLPLPKRVIATSTAGQRYTITVGTSGRFTMSLPPGAYQLAGYSPRVHVGNAEMRCVAAHPVHVRTGKWTPSDVYCSVP
jgi:hypothetical protein